MDGLGDGRSEGVPCRSRAWEAWMVALGRRRRVPTDEGWMCSWAKFNGHLL